MEYVNNPKLMQEHTIRIDASSSATNENKEETDDVNFNQLKLYTNF